MSGKILWQPASRINPSLIPPSLRDCLLDAGSLTARLTRYCKGKFNLHLKRQSWVRPLPDESSVLQLRRGSYALVREIYLRCDDVPWVYGRSIIPARTCTARERRLACWGQRSLGSYLFSERNTRRGVFEIAVIHPRDTLFKLAGKVTAPDNSRLWCRRSIFYIKDKPLLVVEVFLDDLIRCVHT